MGRHTSGSNPTARQAEKYKKDAQAAAKSNLLTATKKLDEVHSKYKDLEKAQDALVKKYQS